MSHCPRSHCYPYLHPGCKQPYAQEGLSLQWATQGLRSRKFKRTPRKEVGRVHEGKLKWGSQGPRSSRRVCAKMPSSAAVVLIGKDATKFNGSVTEPASPSSSMCIEKEQPDPPLPCVIVSRSLGVNKRIATGSPARPQGLPEFSICDLLRPIRSFSTLDDEDWQFASNDQLPKAPMGKVEEGTTLRQVWADAVHLSSVDMYALPYVVPY